MAAIELNEQTLKRLKGKVVVISGSARGIGAATVRQLHVSGAKVIHGDWESDGGHKLDAELLSSSNPSGGESHFVKADVSDYNSVLNLFETAWKKYSRVDIAISNAGIQEFGNWFDPGLDLESVKTKPTTRTIDVNLTGTLYFAHIAVVFLREGAQPYEDKSLVLLSSTAGFKETPGIFIYTASKHGVLGLLRSLRPSLPKSHNIRINAICPWMTDTAMVEGIRDQWVKEGLAINTPGDVGRLILEVAADGKSNGKAVFVEGGRGWDIEPGINATEEVWLGKDVSRSLNRGQEVLGGGTDWTKLDSPT